MIKQVDIVKAYFKSFLTNKDLFIFIKQPLWIETFRFIKVKLVSQLLRNIYKLR